MIERNPNCSDCPFHETVCQQVDSRAEMIDSTRASIDSFYRQKQKAEATIENIEMDVIADMKAEIAGELDAHGIPYTEESLDESAARVDRTPVEERLQRLGRAAADAESLNTRLQAAVERNQHTIDLLAVCPGPIVQKKRFGRQTIVCSTFKTS